MKTAILFAVGDFTFSQTTNAGERDTQKNEYDRRLEEQVNKKLEFDFRLSS